MIPQQRRKLLDRVKAHYKALAPKIMAAGANRWAVDPYAWCGAGIVLTPIENALWCDIRAEGCVVYPQYPVGRYFVDFANPVAKVAIECDGKQWHQDVERDGNRQLEIELDGWTVYRITGSDCKRPDSYEEDELGRERFIPGPARLFIRQIMDSHGIDVRTRAAA